jgi:hypothetical protein
MVETVHLHLQHVLKVHHGLVKHANQLENVVTDFIRRMRNALHYLNNVLQTFNLMVQNVHHQIAYAQLVLMLKVKNVTHIKLVQMALFGMPII